MHSCARGAPSITEMHPRGIVSNKRAFLQLEHDGLPSSAGLLRVLRLAAEMRTMHARQRRHPLRAAHDATGHAVCTAETAEGPTAVIHKIETGNRLASCSRLVSSTPKQTRSLPRSGEGASAMI